jgi:hypothetical protein
MLYTTLNMDAKYAVNKIKEALTLIPLLYGDVPWAHHSQRVQLPLDGTRLKVMTNLVLHGRRALRSGFITAPRLPGNYRKGMSYEGTLVVREDCDPTGEISYIDIRIFYADGYLPPDFLLHATNDMTSFVTD